MALEAYDREYYNFTIKDIELLSGVRIERNRRNYQKQKYHLEEARAVRDIRQKRAGTNWRDNNGRPSKEIHVKKWREENPTGTKASCIRETGFDKKTVYKWWNTDIKNADSKLQ